MKIIRWVTAFTILAMTVCCSETPPIDNRHVMNLMSFNIRYDEPADGINSWKNRKDPVAAMISDRDVDVLGIQELQFIQLTDLLSALPGYTYAGVGRNDGKTGGEYNAIFYKREKFSYDNGGTFWLSKNPAAEGSKDWDATIERIVTWVILTDLHTGKKFAFFNTHFDHVGLTARRESAKLLLLKTEEIAAGLPLFISGDLNSTPGSEPLALLTDQKNKNHVTDSRNLSTQQDGPSWTFHGFGSTPVEKRTTIDYLFVRNVVTVEKFTTIFEVKNNIYLSDHNPILIKAFI